MSKLANKIALITGGTSGIGLATAKEFQKEGATVIVTGRSESTLNSAQKELGPDAVVIKSDTANLNDIKSLIAQIKDKFGRIDTLFVNAGVGAFVPVEQVTEEHFDQLFNINVKGAYFTVQNALPLIPEGGSILLNASTVVHLGLPDASVYSATKAALRSFGRSLAAHLAPKNIRVNTISPGPIKTPIISKLGIPEDQVDEMAATLAAGTAFKRIGEAREIATVAVFLASDDSTFMTGSELLVDGGMADL